MALAIIGALGALGYFIYSTDSETNEKLKEYESRKQYSLPTMNEREREIFEDKDVGNLRVKMNISPFFSVVDDPGTMIVRPKTKEDAWNVWENALSFQDQVRTKNKKLGIDTHFSPNNRKTIIIPSYNSAPVTMLLPNRDVFPGMDQQFFTKVDRESSSLPIDLNAINFRDPWGDVTPFNLPRDNVTALSTIGNPWGPMGVFNRAFIQGGNRLTKKADFVDDSPYGIFPPTIASQQYYFNQ